MMHRRQFTRMVAGGITGLSLIGTASATGRGEPPNENVSISKMGLYPPESEWEVAAGDWIHLQVTWFDGEGGDRTKEDVERWLDAIEFSVWIDGDEVDNANQYWGEVQYLEEIDSWGTVWNYYRPPVQPGRHTVTTEWAYPNGFKDGDFEVGAGEYRYPVYFNVQKPDENPQ